MKKIILVVVFGFVASFGIAQDYSDKQNMEVVTTREAQYSDGEEELYKFIFKEINYSEESKAAKSEGNVQVSFKVNPDGTISNAFVLRGVEPSIDKEVVRILKTLKFLPSIRNGMKVKMSLIYDFPVRAH